MEKNDQRERILLRRQRRNCTPLTIADSNWQRVKMFAQLLLPSELAKSCASRISVYEFPLDAQRSYSKEDGHSGN